MNIIRNRVNDVTVLDIQGVIKLGESAREFSSYLEKVLNDETGPVMINFEAINYMDSTGLGELIGYLQKFEDRQRKMALVKPSHRILALLKITKRDTVFKIFDSREGAPHDLFRDLLAPWKVAWPAGPFSENDIRSIRLPSNRVVPWNWAPSKSTYPAWQPVKSRSTRVAPQSHRVMSGQ